MADAETDIQYIKGVGEARAKRMAKLGIHNLRDLVRAYPRGYEDRTAIRHVAELVTGEAVCVAATVGNDPRERLIRAGLGVTKVSAFDETGVLEITFFNQSYIKDQLRRGEAYVFFGKVGGSPLHPEMTNPIFEREGANSKTGIIAPIYRLTAGITPAAMSNAVRQGLAAMAEQFPNALPRGVREEHLLADARFAYENIHFPASWEKLDIARRRLIFEELFVLAAAMRLFKLARGEQQGRVFAKSNFTEFYAALPFELTGAQKRAIDEAATDMASGERMNRLVQGDVGSGKTAVGAALCWFAAKRGAQSAFMAPTEILAEQHYRTLGALLEPLGVRVGLLTGRLKAKERREVREAIALGMVDVAIGTHALLSEGTQFRDLALVVTDEQHRFGVNQRAALAAKGESPHSLVMSATPIPRTLAFIIYGDMDVSIIDELPPGRQKVETFAVGEKYRKRIYEFARKLVGEGRQVYFVCPAVEESETEELKAVNEYAERLQKVIFPELRVAVAHGAMKGKDAVMSAFAAGEYDILVATTVIEVGVDVPNAALMVVENADRFGLSQLHQLRGRVGRGKHKSYCVLFEGAGNESTNERLRVMRQTNDGFQISEEDLRLRGPGDFFGSRQHGLPELKIASFASDMDVLRAAQQAAETVLAADPELSAAANAPLRGEIERMFQLAVDN
ncbi:MAG: ATP-dependent DNA helicase RecG [Oscillospiraceae bacterium]|nr:ATP-dependent DNA helicase RecG [Oscillospiraceae bacterium]